MVNLEHPHAGLYGDSGTCGAYFSVHSLSLKQMILFKRSKRCFQKVCPLTVRLALLFIFTSVQERISGGPQQHCRVLSSLVCEASRVSQIDFHTVISMKPGNYITW